MTARAFSHRYALPVAGLAAALALSACIGAPPPPPGGGSGSGTGSGGTVAPPTPVACQSASEGETAVVTVEATAAGPDVTSTPVSSPAEADAVVAEAAVGGDLIAVEEDQPRTVDNHVESNDTRRPEQWALDNVNFEDAWAAANNGGTGQVVAVIDTGVRANHPDLAGRVRTGRYFLHSDDGKVTFSGPGATTDSYGHGTHVAGIIGAIANNGQGITGAAPGVEILPVQVLCGDDGSGFSSDVAKGITWAANNGATVINLSLGGAAASSAELQAIQYARNVKNVVVVASAGNSALKGNGANYPAAFPEVIGVGATTSANVRACYSTTGSFVALAAPGGGSSSCPSPSVLSTWKNGGYAGLSGTSMASPHVAAAAALVRAAHGLTTHLAVCNQLIRTADDLGPPNFDNQYGYGLVDPLEAVGAVVTSGVVCT